MWEFFHHKGRPAAELRPRLPAAIDEAEVKRALAARPPWGAQWFEVDAETASFLKPGAYFQGGTVHRVEAASWPSQRFFVLCFAPDDSSS